MATVATIQAKIDKGRGKAGTILGQTFDVYRLNPKSTGSIIQASNLVISGYKAYVKHDTHRLETESNVIVKAVPRFIFTSDSRQIQLGDVFVERTDAFRHELPSLTDGNIFTFAYFRPIRRLGFVSTPISGQVSRAKNNPNSIDSGLVPYGGMSKGLEQVLILKNGYYSWGLYGGTQPPAVIPMSIQATSGKGELPRPNLRLPTDVKRQTWDVYFAMLPGYIPTESHIVTGANGDRYFMQTPTFNSVGFVGVQSVCEKLRV